MRKKSAKDSSTNSNFRCKSLRKTKYGSPAEPPNSSSTIDVPAVVNGSDNSELIRFRPNRRLLLATEMVSKLEVSLASSATEEYMMDWTGKKRDEAVPLKVVQKVKEKAQTRFRAKPLLQNT